jgi:RHS repeat-associated protein
MHAPAIDAPMATWFGQLTPTTKTYDLGTNARGDVTVVAKAGSLSEEQLLDPYGEREAKVGSNATCVEGKEAGTASLPVQKCTTLTILQRFGIGGARQHPATKLVDLRNRVYATHLRGFLTKDPMGSIDSDGLYNYVAGDPVNLRDPWGLDAAAGDAVGPELDPESIPAEGTGREMVIQRQRCDAECQAKREAAAERGMARTNTDQSRSDRKLPSNAPSTAAAAVAGVAGGLNGIRPGLPPGGTPPPMYAPGAPAGGWQMPARGFGNAPRVAPGAAGPPRMAPTRMAPRFSLPGGGFLRFLGFVGYFWASPISDGDPDEEPLARQIERALIGKFGPEAEGWTVEIDEIKRSIVNPDPMLGPQQIRIQVNIIDQFDDPLPPLSVNYDPETGGFGIIKESSGKK